MIIVVVCNFLLHISSPVV